MSLHILNKRRELLKIIYFIHRGKSRVPVFEGKIFVCYGGVVYYSVALDNIRYTVDLAARCHRQGLIGQMLIKLGIRQVGAVVLPIGIAPGSVDLKQSRSLIGGHFRCQCGFIFIVRGGVHYYPDARLLFICLCKLRIY